MLKNLFHWCKLVVALSMIASIPAARAATTITLPDILAIELPTAGQSSINANAEPIASLLAAATAGGLQVTNDKSEAAPAFSFPLGGTLVTWTAWAGVPHASTVSATYSTYVFVFRNGQTPIGVSGDDYALAGNHGSSIARDSSGALHVAWLDDGANPDGSLRAYRIWYRRGIQDPNTGTVSWTSPVDVANGTSTWFSFVKIAASANAVHFAWGGNANNSTVSPINYRRLVHSGSNWTFEPIQVLSGLTGVNHDNGPCIAAYSDNEVHIVTRNLLYAYNMSVGLPASSWVVEQLPQPSGMLSSKYPAVAVDSRGDVHVAYTAMFRDPSISGSGNYNAYAKVWYLHRKRPGGTIKWVEAFDVNANFPEWQDPGPGLPELTPTDVAADWMDIACDDQDSVHIGWHGTAVSHAWGHDDAFCTRRVLANDGNALGFERPQRLHRHEDDPVNGFQYSWTPSFCTGSNGLCIPVIQYKSLGMVDPNDLSNSFQIYDDMDAIARVLQNGQFIDGGNYVPLSQVAINRENIASVWPSASRRVWPDAAGHLWLDVVQGMDCSLVFNPANIGVVLNNQNFLNRTYIVYQHTDLAPYFTPIIVNQPANATVTVGQMASFSVIATGGGTLSYQWSRDGVIIDGATGASYTTPITTATDDGSTYTVLVSNASGSATSLPATLTVTPLLSWSVPADIGYGTPLGAAQLNADAQGFPGTFIYNPPTGSYLSAGIHQTLSVTFVPDNTLLAPLAASTSINVLPAQLNVFADNQSFHFGNAVPVLTSTFIGLVNGDTQMSIGLSPLITTPVTSLTLPGNYPIDITGMATTANYSVTYFAGTISVTNTLPVAFDQTVTLDENGSMTPITLSAADADGDPLTWQLVWYPTAGTLTGTPPNLSYTPAPNDFGTHHFGFEVFDPAGIAGNQPSTIADVTIVINHTGPIAAFSINPSPGAIGKPVTFDAGVVSNTDNTIQSFTWNFGDGTNSVVTSTAQTTHTYATSTTFTVTLTVTDTLGATAVATNKVTVYPVNPVITWSNPSSITYPTPLSSTQLNAKANVAGTFVYSPPLGTVLHAGSGQTLSVTFTPTDNVTFNTVSKSVKISVNKATPTISWSPQTPITWPTPIGPAQQNATTTAIGGGTFSYSIAGGTVLNPGSYSMVATLTPTDTLDYKTNSLTRTITVNKFTPIYAWIPATPITYPAPLGAAQLNATFGDAFGGALAGAATYTPGTGTVLSAGSHTLKVSFTPTDTVHYNSISSKSVSIVVNKGTPIVTWNTPAPIAINQALSSTQLNATASVAGKFTYTPASGTKFSTAGTYTLSVKFTPTDTNYVTVTATVQIVVQ
jgi:hypothetical protein